MIGTDKENVYPMHSGERTTFAHQGGTPTKKPSSRKGAFNSLLRDASNKVREEHDTQLAVNITVDEAVDMMKEWVQENQDNELAQKLSNSYKEELKLSRKIELEKGEAEALRMAIEESRRVRAAAKAREDAAKEDAKYAKQLHDAEEKCLRDRDQMYRDDEKLARSVSESDHKHYAKQKYIANADAKSDNGDEKSQTDDKEDEDSFLEDKADDSEESRQQLKDACAKYIQYEKDLDMARAQQRNFDRDHRQAKLEQEADDRNLSHRLMMKTQWEEHREKKFRQYQRSYEFSVRDDASVAKMWKDCIAEPEDVQGAVCITLFLPNVAVLNVTAEKGGYRVVIAAKRMVKENESVKVTKENSQYIAEFNIQGSNLKLREDVVTYEYSSDSGLLHVYIEGVSLEANSSESSSSKQQRSTNYTTSDACAKGERASFHGRSRSGAAGLLVDGFQRIFSSSK